MSCDKHEPERRGDYRICGECGHIFRTEADLIAEDDKWEMRPGKTGDTIYMCPLCTHDF